MDATVRVRQRERTLARRRLNLYTKRIAIWSGALAVGLSVVAAQSNPGRATPGSAQTNAQQQPATGQGGSASQSNQGGGQNSGWGGGSFFGSGGGPPMTVSGGS